ncbi:MAG: DUF2177 family protein [Patescibacteria group bacterium]
MNLVTFVTLYALSVPLFFIIDLLWLGVIAKSFYRTRLDHLMGDINWPAAIIFYLVFLLGLTFFALYPAAEKSSVITALTLGALYGFFTYATYDLTNLATLRDWPLQVVIVDMLWGTVLGASVAAGAVYLFSLFS